MKRIALLLALVLAASCSGPQLYVKKAVFLMDRQGLFAVGPEWDEAKAAALAARPASIEEAQDVVKAALKVAGGKHSFIKTADWVVEDEDAQWEMPSVSVSEDGIATIKLPFFSGNREEERKYTQTILEGLPDELHGAVIDLRGNLGGNMYPMIASVHRFIKDGENMLRFRGRKRTSWIPMSFVLSSEGVQAGDYFDCPVAILTDSLTASSGEATLICFLGEDKVRTFGGPTAGYASCNSSFRMPDGSYLVLTTGCDVSRTGEVFCDDPIVPDVLTDSPLDSALLWLQSQQ